MENITIKELIKLKKDNMDLNEVFLKKDCINAEYSYVLEEKDLAKSYVHCSIPGFDYGKKYLFLGDRENAVLIPVLREDYNTNYDYNNLIIIDTDNLDKCDVCNKASIKDILLSISPEVTAEMEDLKENFEDFDGFMCTDCYESNLSEEYKSRNMLIC